MPSSQPSRRPSKSRRWRIPPAPAHVTESFLATGVLEENGGELGALLWRCVRAARAWSTTLPADRGDLFAPGVRDRRMADLLASGAPEALERSLRVLIEMQGDPVRIGADRVALSCVGVAGWAEREGKRATAEEFTHAAALACPGSPVYALACGRRSRDEGRYTEAEAMYQRAVALARQVQDWDSYTRAHAGLGKVSQQRGAYPAARRALQKALYRAERHALRPLRAMVLHDLFTVERECGRDTEAEAYAEAAAQAYGVGHVSLTALAGDVGIFWIDQGRFAEAYTVLRRILPLVEGEVRLIVLGNLARVAGAVGDEATFHKALREVMRIPEDTPRRVDALHAAVRGAVNLGALDEAEAAATLVLEAARVRGEHRTVFEMEAVLEQAMGLRRLVRCPVQVAPASVEAPCSLLRTLERVLEPVGAQD
jgi:tetratricopeptide (TPR) repeat protein